MPRPIWKGAISFGLVTVPVGLHPATERAAEIRFRLLHAKDSSPIDYKRVCEAEGVEVAWSEIARGYEFERDRYVILTEKDFARARVEATHTLAIRDFVPAGSIGALHVEQPYLPAPKKPARVTSLVKALEQSLAEYRRPPARAAGRRGGARPGRRLARRAA